MRVYDIISKKRYNKELTYEEIKFFVENYLAGHIKDYQMSALLMAICINSMTDNEVFHLTEIFRDSGDIIDFSKVQGNTVDKHSTGGVGDKTTFIIVPIVAACGIKTAKMSGKGLGHTGGTIDKIMSIPNVEVEREFDEIIKQVNDIGAAIVGQSANLVLADKKIYALRDVTATVESIPLIASSVMSKKLALNTDSIVLEVTVGNGAFMKSVEDARKLAELMIKIGNRFNKKVSAFITDMDEPLGFNIGNSLEIEEVIKVLKGKGEKKLIQLCLEISASMIAMSLDISNNKAYDMARRVLESGKAYDKFLEIVKYQGGDIDVVKGLRFNRAKNKKEIYSEISGYISNLDALKIGQITVELGAGRECIEDEIDYSAGIILNKKVGDYVDRGDKIMTLYSNKNIEIDTRDLFNISKDKQLDRPIIYDRLGYGFN